MAMMMKFAWRNCHHQDTDKSFLILIFILPEKNDSSRKKPHHKKRNLND
jgi:hypothetical protein